ncbi:hypothetical protein GQ53DRAFT_458289 [Thozetella sp. PMI_491]|nr:hypothetical protein GQ53DRAFT_458289 [Thozetella sp. PMI_491]
MFVPRSPVKADSRVEVCVACLYRPLAGAVNARARDILLEWEPTSAHTIGPRAPLGSTGFLRTPAVDRPGRQCPVLGVRCHTPYSYARRRRPSPLYNHGSAARAWATHLELCTHRRASCPEVLHKVFGGHGHLHILRILACTQRSTLSTFFWTLFPTAGAAFNFCCRRHAGAAVVAFGFDCSCDIYTLTERPSPIT